MEQAAASRSDTESNPDGVLAVVVLVVVGAVYATYVRILNLLPEATMAGAGLTLVALATLVGVLGLWQRRLWGYLGTVVVAGGTGFVFIRSGDPLAGATAMAVFGYLLGRHRAYLLDQSVDSEG